MAAPSIDTNPTPWSHPVPTATATAVINLDIEGPTINRHLYGHFAEHLGRCIYGGFWVGEDSPIPNEGVSAWMSCGLCAR